MLFQFNGEIIGDFPLKFDISYGTRIVLKYENKLKIFFCVGMDATTVFLTDKA